MIHHNQAFQDIKKGMDVYDVNGKQVGTVQSFHYGGEDTDETTPNIHMIQQLLEPLLNDPRQFPEVIYNRMYREGFLRVQRGLLRSDAYVFAGEVERVAGQDIHLNVPKDELLEG